jgi:hypothetical protein
MLDVNVALKALEAAPTPVNTGPKGGLIDNPVYHPEARRSHFNSPHGLDALHRFEKNDTTRQGIQNEQPWHRMAAFMLNAGRTNSEIALAAGKDVGAVSQLRSNRWFQELCATIANNVGEELVGLIQSEAQESIETIVSLRDGSESDRIRLTAAITLLEHAHGKPTQKVVTDITHRRGLSPEEERRQLEDELNNIRGRQPAQLQEV